MQVMWWWSAEHRVLQVSLLFPWKDKLSTVFALLAALLSAFICVFLATPEAPVEATLLTTLPSILEK